MAINFQNTTSLDTGANSDLQVDVILQEALDTFQKDLGWFNSIHRDFGGEAMRFNQSVLTRIFQLRAKSDVQNFSVPANTNVTPAVPASEGYNLGAEASDAQPVSVTLNKHKYIKFAMTDLEREESSISYISDIAKQAAHALGRYVIDDIIEDCILTANSAEITSVGQANWGKDDFFKIAQTMDELDMPSEGRWIVMSPQAYYATLESFTSITNASFGIKTGIQKATTLSEIGGFNCYVYNGLQSISNTNNASGKQTGFDILAGYSGSLAVVSRLPEFADASMQIGDIANATEPSSGISLQLRRKYDVFNAKEEYALTCMYGHKALKDSVSTRMFKQIIT